MKNLPRPIAAKPIDESGPMPEATHPRGVTHMRTSINWSDYEPTDAIRALLEQEKNMSKDWHHTYPSRFLKAIDLDDDTPATIKTVREERLGFGSDASTTLVLYFKEALKPLPLNRTMCKTLADVTGTDDYDRWAGTSIELYTTIVDAFGEAHQVIRLRAPQVKRSKAAKPEADELDTALPETF